METQQTKPSNWQERQRLQTVKLAAWTAAWVVTMAIASFGPQLLWQSRELTLLAIGVNLLVGAGMIIANRDHLKSLDELQQKVQLEAMSITLGVGLIAGLAYSNLDTSNVVPFDAEISHLVIGMGLTYLVSLVFLNRKYR